MALELTPDQNGEVRDALLAGIDRESSATWTEKLVRVVGSTKPAAGDVAACVSRVLANKAYCGFDSYD